MGAASSIDLRPEELSELQELTGFTPKEIRYLYQRFRKLDRGNKGTITTDDLLMVPELSMNPLAPRIISLFDSENEGQINFSFFLSVLSVFSERTGREPKLKFIFAMWDVDDDGHISAEDMRQVLETMVGPSMTESEIQVIISRTMQAAGLTMEDKLSVYQFEMVCSYSVALNRVSSWYHFLALPIPLSGL
eukprot:gb/GECG01006099.1/.p1 GENE.gb/GECG01006099.1/~~gb/GECG01006099.1/.p1  ORF type:complete len:191 (+),score=21.47 gb/GECG01006099.1/:1-573(+)